MRGRSTRGQWCLLFPRLPVGVLGGQGVFWEAFGAWGGRGWPGVLQGRAFCRASEEPGRFLGSLGAWWELGGVLGSGPGVCCPRWLARSAADRRLASFWAGVRVLTVPSAQPAGWVGADWRAAKAAIGSGALAAQPMQSLVSLVAQPRQPFVCCLGTTAKATIDSLLWLQLVASVA